MRRFLVLGLVLAGCSLSNPAPDANRALRAVSLTSEADSEASAIADSAHHQLESWCQEAIEIRELGDPLPEDSPLLDGRADAEVLRIADDALALAESPELIDVLEQLAAAYADRLAVFRRPGKFAVKKQLQAERRVAELGFGLRRWRLQR